MDKMQKKNFAQPDESREFPSGRVEIAKIGGITWGRAKLEPGWRWSTSIKPTAKTPSCQASHLQYHIAGRLKVVMDDGSEAEYGPGEISLLPPGHDAWVVGDEPVVVLDISGMVDFGKKS